MASIDNGKAEVVAWIKQKFPKGSTCLDVGACDGKWADLLGDWLKMDAVEVFAGNIQEHHLQEKYWNVFCANISFFKYDHYDLILFGDVIEHMTVEQAQEVLEYARPRCKDMVISVPYHFSQDEQYGNPWEKHLQPDLDDRVFSQRYPGFRILLRPQYNYAYYITEKNEPEEIIRTESHGPFFSIIIPTHNGRKTLGRMIQSITQQTFTDYEIIIVCDSCTDGTEEYAVSIEDDLNRIRVFHTDDHNDGLARNLGLDAAIGQWILFADDDDWFLHEYVFELLAKKLKEQYQDVLDFAFVWKGEGFKIPRPDDCFIMVWCRAWRRDFIGDNRMQNIPYGADVDFFNRMIRHNPDAVVTYWDQPVYYYNYLREGSLSWMEKQKTYLDIVLSHHDEPWELGKPFFDILSHQACTDLNKINLIITQDADGTELPWKDLLRPYRLPHVRVVRTEQHGTGNARNAGLKACTSEWVMFMNFDDHFADVCSVAMILDNLPTTEYDLIWMKIAQEERWMNGGSYIQTHDAPNYSTTDGKMYRREAIEEHHLRFVGDKYNYAYVFNCTFLAVVPPFRIVKLTTDFFPYFKPYRADSLRHTEKYFSGIVEHLFRANMLLAEELRTRQKDFAFRRTIAKMFALKYHDIFCPDREKKPTNQPVGFLKFYKNFHSILASVSPAELDAVLDEASAELLNAIQHIYNERGEEYYLVNDDITFETWLERVDREEKDLCCDPQEIPREEQAEPDPDQQEEIHPSPLRSELSLATNPRVVVYCGTYDVYANMMASAKSLLCNTPVDEIYFLIEDDVFPYDLPDSIHTINIKPLGNELFTPSGPNYNNSWTWMCMIRAAFPEIFSQYHRILSLDCDVVINDNVSDLWDYAISDYYLAGVPERQRQKTSADPMYINFGVVLMNLDKLRNDSIQPKLIESLNTRKYGCPEQDAYNKFCAGKILELPTDFNVTVYSHITGEPQKERILHYAGQKFWRHYSQVKQYADLPWDEVIRRQNALKGETDNAET